MADDRPRRGGRPRLDPDGLPSAAVMLKLRPADYDKAWAVARQRRESIQDIIRRGLKRELEHPPR